VAFGVDPKTVLCIFYKQGNCEKGRKCKFSHDSAVERKGEKKNLYQDRREDQDEAKKKDDMADWDEGRSQHEPPPTFLALLRKNANKIHEFRKTPPSRNEQTRQPKNHNRQSLQILRQRRRRGQVRLVLDLP